MSADDDVTAWMVSGSHSCVVGGPEAAYERVNGSDVSITTIDWLADAATTDAWTFWSDGT